MSNLDSDLDDLIDSLKSRKSNSSRNLTTTNETPTSTPVSQTTTTTTVTTSSGIYNPSEIHQFKHEMENLLKEFDSPSSSQTPASQPQKEFVPTGPKPASVPSAEKMAPVNLEGQELICAGCGQQLRNVVVEAHKLSWHPNCLRCRTCLTSLVEKKFIPGEQRNHLYCTTCGLKWLHASGKLK